MQELPPLPRELLVQLSDYEARKETSGCSDAALFRLRATNRPSLIAKLSAAANAAHLLAEADRLKWTKGVAIRAPQVMHLAEADGYFWLVMKCLPGENAAISCDPPGVKIYELAKALKAVHMLGPNDYPFDETLTVKLARAAQRMKSDDIDVDDFDNENLGKTASELFGELRQSRPRAEDIVVVHGDALPNIMLNGGQFSGFVDCGRLGRSDRYQDLALACRSVSTNLGPEWSSRSSEPMASRASTTAVPASIGYWMNFFESRRQVDRAGRMRHGNGVRQVLNKGRMPRLTLQSPHT